MRGEDRRARGGGAHPARMAAPARRRESRAGDPAGGRLGPRHVKGGEPAGAALPGRRRAWDL